MMLHAYRDSRRGKMKVDLRVDVALLDMNTEERAVWMNMIDATDQVFEVFGRRVSRSSSPEQTDTEASTTPAPEASDPS